MAGSENLRKTVIRVPERPTRTPAQLALHAAKGASLAPVYCLLAALRRGPGLGMRARAAALALRAALAGRRRLSLRAIFHLLFMPMESTRYFELDFAWRLLARRPMRRYLDVSSPRLLPVALLAARDGLTADLINPNRSDLEETARWVDVLGLTQRCRLHDQLIADAPFAPGTFDVVTCISVLEHIPEDAQAVRRIWELLAPGGAFVLTVPCMAAASEQYIDRDEFGVLQPGADGTVFWQRFYDHALLQRNVFAVTGPPRYMRVYGEKVAGALARNSERKRADPAYPYWREPWMMAAEYQAFDALERLPGEGVVGLLFEKPG